VALWWCTVVSPTSNVYEVDLDTYTCTCLDYPLISFCKHICAVQDLFREDGVARDPAQDFDEDVPAQHFDDDVATQGFDEAGAAAEALPTSSNVPSLSTLGDSSSDSRATSPFDVPKTPALTTLAEKLERLAARLRRPRQKNSALTSMADLEYALDTMLTETDNSSVPTSSQHIEPNTKTLFKQTLNAMMPGIKTRRVPAGDCAYGAGASSGGKAREPRRKCVTILINNLQH
jgi:hypothetical protein